MAGWLCVSAVILAVVVGAVLALVPPDAPSVVLECEPLEEGAAVTPERVEEAASILSERLAGKGTAMATDDGRIRLVLDEMPDDTTRLDFLIGVGELELAVVPKHFLPVRGGWPDAWDRPWEDHACRRGSPVGDGLPGVGRVSDGR